MNDILNNEPVKRVQSEINKFNKNIIQIVYKKKIDLLR